MSSISLAVGSVIMGIFIFFAVVLINVLEHIENEGELSVLLFVPALPWLYVALDEEFGQGLLVGLSLQKSSSVKQRIHGASGFTTDGS